MLSLLLVLWLLIVSLLRSLLGLLVEVWIHLLRRILIQEGVHLLLVLWLLRLLHSAVVEENSSILLRR